MENWISISIVDILANIDKEVFENIDIDKELSKNIDIDTEKRLLKKKYWYQ